MKQKFGNLIRKIIPLAIFINITILSFMYIVIMKIILFIRKIAHK